jgi:hypothetical protein
MAYQFFSTLLLAAIGLIGSTVVAAAQPSSPGTLSTALRKQVNDARFGVVSSIRGLPLGVRDELQTMFGTATLDIAEPGAEFQVTDVIVKPNLPTRRLIMAGCTIDLCLIYYERGGLAHTWHVALFHWTPATTRLEWGGRAPASLATLDGVRKAVLSGAINISDHSW